MSRTYRDNKYRIEGDRRSKPDARRLAKALLAWVEAKREAEALADDQKRRRRPKRRRTDRGAA